MKWSGPRIPVRVDNGRLSMEHVFAAVAYVNNSKCPGFAFCSVDSTTGVRRNCYSPNEECEINHPNQDHDNGRGSG